MKKKSKLIILLGLVFTMLFGNIFTVSAAETTANWWQMITGKSVLGSSFEFQGNISDINNHYDISLAYGESSVPVYGYAYAVQGTAYGPNSYSVNVCLYSESPFTVMGRDINCNGDEIESQKENLKSYDVVKSSYQGKEYYFMGFNSVNTGIIKSDLPVNLIKPEKPIYNFNQLLDYLLGGGDSDFIYKPDEMESYDKTLGYLHDLHHKKLVTKTSEEGFPLESTDKFTWSDSYPDYDKTYKVDLYVICNVQERSMWLPWKKKTFSSSRTYVKSGLYKDLELGVTNDELNAIFSSFHSPDGNSNSIFKVRSWNYDFYFRIVKDEKYGPWTIWKHTGEVLDGEVDGSVSVGEEDENGNIILIPDTEYGQGMPDDTEVGVGDDEKDAEDNIGQDQFEIKDILSWVDWFFNTLKSFISSMKDLPSLFASIFSFLPSPIVFLLSAVIVVIIILRILGR